MLRTENNNFAKEEQCWIVYTNYTLKAYNSTLTKTVQHCKKLELLHTFQIFPFMKYLLVFQAVLSKIALL